MKKKRIFLGIGSLAAVSAPIMGIVSCDSNKEDDNGVIKLKEFLPNAAIANPLNIETDKSNWKTVLAIDGSTHTKNDNGFNQQVFEAITDAGAAIDVRSENSVKPSKDDTASFIGMYNALPTKTIIVAAGFFHVEPLSKSVNGLNGKAAILLDGYAGKSNIASVEFKAYEAAFLGGIQAGYYLNKNYETYKSGGLKVATFGGLDIAAVTSFMIGFQQGIKYFNKNLPTINGKKAEKIIFMDNGGKNDYFSGGFATGGGTTITQKIIGKGADIIFPVSAPQVIDVLKVIKTKESKTKVIGVDAKQEDIFKNTYPDTVIFSILKDLKVATTKILQIVSGDKDKQDSGFEGIGGFGEHTIGTLANGLVGISKTSQEAYDFATSADAKEAAKKQTLEFNY